MASRIIGCGGYLPEKILQNSDLEKFIDTTDEWISSRSGIKQRHVAGEKEFTSHMAWKAALGAIADADINKEEIDLIIVCTTTPDQSFPSVGCKLQSMLGLKNIPAFDLQAVCSGFLYGLDVANHMLKGSAYKTILLVCAEKMTSLLDWNDRSTSVLFGDGAGAVILKQDNKSKRGIIDTQIYADGSFGDILHTDGGISSTKSCGVIKMDGRATFRLAIDKMSESISSILKKNNLTLDDVDYLIAHQANIRIINSIAKRIQLDSSKIIATIDKHANCSAASIPLALNDVVQKGLLQKGKIVVFVAFGAGSTWGSSICRW